MALWEKGFHHRDISPGNMMYYRDEAGVVGVLNDWDLAAVIPSSGSPNTDRTGTIPFMALQLLSAHRVPHMFRHDAESFIWLFLWVCGCSDGSEKEVLVAPYNVWRRLDMLACKEKRGDFLSAVSLEAINVSEHHGRNALFCLFLARLLQQLRTDIWQDIPTSAKFDSKEQRDMALLKELLPQFTKARDELNKNFSPKDWLDDDLRDAIRRDILLRVHRIILKI
jgi:serine/threonine protein kinase